MSVTVRVPFRVPATLGLNVTLMVQEAPAATLAPQLLVWEKSPLVLIPETVSLMLPVLVRVTL